MNRILIFILTTLLFIHDAVAGNSPRVLVVVSGYGADEGKTRPGFEMQEFATAYWVFADHGLNVDVASPQGGTVVADRYDPDHPAIARLFSDSEAAASITETLALSALTGIYDAVFVVGGKGAMFDLPGDLSLQNHIAKIYETGGIVSAVCHGPAALTEVKLSDDSYLVANRSVNGFSNLEEQMFSRRWIKEFDFMLEDRLVERGADFSAGPMMLQYVVEDERLVTGQNPASTAAVAESVIRQLGIPVQTRQLDQEERTFALLLALLNGEGEAKQELASGNKQYNRQLIAMYLYYYAKGATDTSQTITALELMTLVPEHLDRPQIQLQIAKSHLALDQTESAKAVLKTLAESHPEFEPGISLLATVEGIKTEKTANL